MSFQDPSDTLQTKPNIEVSKTININLSVEDFVQMFNPYNETNEFNAMSVLDKLKSFFNSKTNSQIFASELQSIIKFNYTNVYVNIRKLNDLCKTDKPIFQSMFNSQTPLKNPDNTSSFTMVYEEIALDFKRMVDQSESEDPSLFFSSVIAGDSVTILFQMDMSGYSTTYPTLSTYIKFNAVSSTSQYAFSII